MKSKGGLSQGTIHEVPSDLKKVILSNKEIKTIWETLTPLGRNEFICWITSAKKIETRIKRIDWMCSSLVKGKRRPCCWQGCPHHNKNTQKYFK